MRTRGRRRRTRNSSWEASRGGRSILPLEDRKAPVGDLQDQARHRRRELVAGPGVVAPPPVGLLPREQVVLKPLPVTLPARPAALVERLGGVVVAVPEVEVRAVEPADLVVLGLEIL